MPCIQTLGHLGQILQWPKYHVYRDTNEVLLANWDETYNLIEKVRSLLSTVTRVWQSNPLDGYVKRSIHPDACFYVLQVDDHHNQLAAALKANSHWIR